MQTRYARANFFFRTLVVILAPTVCLWSWSAEATPSGELTILFTGEMHARIVPSQAFMMPGGGIAPMATIIDSIRQEAEGVLLLDAGGFLAGGALDPYAGSGAQLPSDHERNALQMKAMGAIYEYLACVGEEEVAAGVDWLSEIASGEGVTLLSANTADQHDVAPFSPYAVAQVIDWRVLVVGLSPVEEIERLPGDAVGPVVVRDPAETLRETLASLEGNRTWDLTVVLSHLGERESRKLVSEVEGIDILIGAHRRDNILDSYWLGNTLMTFCRYGGTTIGSIAVRARDGDDHTQQTHLPRCELGSMGEGNPSPSVVGPQATDWVSAFEVIPVPLSVPAHPDVARLLSASPIHQRLVDATREVPTLDLEVFLMSLCEPCLEAERSLIDLLDTELGEYIRPEVVFVLQEGEGGVLTSPEGPEEIAEDKRQICMLERYPGEYWDYLSCRLEGGLSADWVRCAVEAGIDPSEITTCERNDDTASRLTDHFLRCLQKDVSFSPVMFIDGHRYDGGMDYESVARQICQRLPNSMTLPTCASLPLCREDEDCMARGLRGRCLGSGREDSRCGVKSGVDSVWTVAVLWDPMTRLAPLGQVATRLGTLFPGASFCLLVATAPEVVAAARSLGVKRSPAYILPKIAEGERGFRTVSADFVSVGDFLLLRPEAAGSGVLLDREYVPDRVDVFVSSLSVQGNRLATHLWERSQESGRDVIRIRFMLQIDSSGQLTGAHGPREVEEARRQMVIREEYPDKYLQYLRELESQLESSYWERPLEAVGLDPATVRKKAESGVYEQALREDAIVCLDLDLSRDVQLLFDNREIASYRDRRELSAILAAIEEILTAPQR